MRGGKRREREQEITRDFQKSAPMSPVSVLPSWVPLQSIIHTVSYKQIGICF